jgi:general secretion pathway protein J
MKSARGFTLIEIMIAVLISAILAVMAFEAMQQALSNRDRIRANAARLQALQFTMRSFVQDFSQLDPRLIREPLGAGYQPAIEGTAGATSQVSFTRAGWSNPVGLERSTLQRVRYVVRDARLYREYWTVLDAQLDPAPVSRQLLDGVDGFAVRYMNDGHSWQETWPPAAQSGARTQRELRWRPIAVEITLQLNDMGRVTRLIEVAG